MRYKDHGRLPAFLIQRTFFLVTSLCILLLSVGCRNCEVVETALRMREQDLLLMREELMQMEFRNEALKRELCAIRGEYPATTLRVSPELAAQTYMIQRISLGRSTGGFDDDHVLGDEALQVVIAPRDVNDDVIKAPGTAQITALEVSTQGLKTPIGTWVVTENELRSKWKQGIFTNGYVLVLPWQKQPTNEKIRVVVRFRIADGRLFEADKDVRLRLPPLMPRTKNGVFPPMPQELAPPGPVIPPAEPLPITPKVLPPPDVPGSPSSPREEGPPLQPAGHWRTPSLEDAFQLQRPQPIIERKLPAPP